MLGGVLSIDSSQALSEALERFGTFTLMQDYGIWGSHQVALVSNEGAVIDAGTLSDARMRVTGQRGLRYVRHIEIFPPVGLEEIRRELPSRARAPFARGVALEGRLPQGTWTATVQALARLRPHHADALLSLSEPPKLDTPARRIAAFDKDAVSLAAEIFGAQRRDRLALRRTPATRGGDFLRALTQGRAREDPVIAYDAQRMPGMDGFAHPNGVTEFSRGDELLVVCNVNKMPLETTLGADLIYYNEPLDAFVLVQYKMLRAEGDKQRYRPDSQLHDEIERMQRIPTGRFAGDPPAWRLHPGCGYIKLCDAPTSNRAPEQLLRGLYLPLDYLKALDASPDHALGKKGGPVLSRETIGRHISNDLFVPLVRGGWIGTYSATSQGLASVVRAQYDAGHSVTVAAQRTIRDWKLNTRRPRRRSTR